MIKVNHIDFLNMKRITNTNLLSVKDSYSYQYITNGKYYVSSNCYLDKLYKSIGMLGIRFVKQLYEFDSEYMIKSVNTRLNNQKDYEIYIIDDPDQLIVLSHNVYSNYKKIIDNVNKYGKVYYTDNWDHSKFTCLFLNDSNLGLFIEINLNYEIVNFYYVEVNDSKLYLIYDSQISLTDKESTTFIDSVFNNIHSISNMFNKEVLNTKLSLSEYEYLMKVMKLSVTDDDRSKMTYLSNIKKDITPSDYTVYNMFNIVLSNIESINLSNVTYFYNFVINEDLKIFKLRT